jgi:quercetin dioxygenase-like cupin family protein
MRVEARGIVAVALVSAFASAAQAADPPAPARTVAQQATLSGAPNEEVILTTVVFPPGAKLPFHTHPGEELGVVTSGTLKIEFGDRPPLLVHAGESYLVPRGVRHQPSAAEGETRLVATFIVDKGAPLATAAP